MRGFLLPKTNKTCCSYRSELHVYVCTITDQGFKIIMLKHVDMTGKSRLVFNAVTDVPATAGEIAWLSNLTDSCCRLILTQLAMAGLIKENIKERTYQNI